MIENRKNNIKETLINDFKEKNIIFKEGNDLDIIIDKKRYNYKIIIFFIEKSFLSYYLSSLTNLRNMFQINQYNKFLFYLKIQKMKEQLDNYTKVFNFNFGYYDNINDIIKEIEFIEKNNTDTYKEYIKFIENELFYKFLIGQYINLFNRTIYDNTIKYHDKKDLILMKINQDIQFFKNFDFDNNISLSAETINDFKNKLENKKIEKIIDNFLKKENILNEINLLIELEEEIDEKINQKNENVIFLENNDISKKNVENIFNDNNEQNKEKNGNKKVDENDKNNNISNNEKEEEKKNVNEKVLDLFNQIKECEKLLDNKKERKNIIKNKSSNNNLLLLMTKIEVNLKKRLKNEILIIIYMIFQKSIIHQFEKLFIKLYLSKD